MPLNIFKSIYSIHPGICISMNAQFKNILSCKFVRLLDKVIEDKLVQLLNAYELISIMLLGIIIDVIWVFANEREPIVVIIYYVPW